MGHTKIVRTDLNSPCRELSVRGLGFVVALPVFSGINFVCAPTERAIQLLSNSGMWKLALLNTCECMVKDKECKDTLTLVTLLLAGFTKKSGDSVLVKYGRRKAKETQPWIRTS